MSNGSYISEYQADLKRKYEAMNKWVEAFIKKVKAKERKPKREQSDSE